MVFKRDLVFEQEKKKRKRLTFTINNFLIVF